MEHGTQTRRVVYSYERLRRASSHTNDETIRKCIPNPSKRDIALIVADVLNHENFTVYSTCIISQTAIITPKNKNMKPRNESNADIFVSPYDP